MKDFEKEAAALVDYIFTGDKKRMRSEIAAFGRKCAAEAWREAALYVRARLNENDGNDLGNELRVKAEQLEDGAKS